MAELGDYSMLFGINLFTFVSLDDELQLHQSLSMCGHNMDLMRFDVRSV